MGIRSVKRMASELLKAGISRIRVINPEEAEKAITRQDVKNLIKKGLVIKVQKKGTSKFASRKLKLQKKKGRRRGKGSRKGKKTARNPKKPQWIKTIRALRSLLKELKDNGQIERKVYTEFYKRIGGGEFRNKKHLLTYLKEHELLKKRPRRSKNEKVENIQGSTQKKKRR